MGASDVIWKRKDGFVACDMQGEQVLLDLDSGMYYGIGGVGTRVWEIIETPNSTSRILELIESEYDVDPEVLKEDVGRFLEQLESNGLIDANSKSPEKDNTASS